MKSLSYISSDLKGILYEEKRCIKMGNSFEEMNSNYVAYSGRICLAAAPIELNTNFDSLIHFFS